MRNFAFILIWFLAGMSFVPGARALPAPSSLAAREHRATGPAVPRATPTPVVQQRRASGSDVQRQSTTVVVDPGHGGFDRGGISGQRVSESMMNLDVALRLQTVLQAYGYRVVMTRDRDVFIPLGTRVAIANSYRDAIFVCIHFNATPRSAASGSRLIFTARRACPLLPRFIITWPA